MPIMRSLFASAVRAYSRARTHCCLPSDLAHPAKRAVGRASLANRRFGNSNPHVATRGGSKEIVGLVVLSCATWPSLLPPIPHGPIGGTLLVAPTAVADSARGRLERFTGT